MIMGIENRTATIKKLIQILRRLIPILGYSAAIREIMTEVNKYLRSRKRLYLSDTAAYLIQSSVDCDFHG